MKRIDVKRMLVTVIVCLLPMIAGAVLYNQLPEQMAVHFNLNNEADNYASKAFAVFALPVFMALLQIFCCASMDITRKEKKKKTKFEEVGIWIIPVLDIVCCFTLIGNALWEGFDIRRIICLVLGLVYIVMGNYMPKMSYEVAKGIMHPVPKSEQSFRKMIRVLGYTFIIVGILLLISLFFAGYVTVAVIVFMLIAFAAESIWMISNDRK